jgi:hypothetical protein
MPEKMNNNFFNKIDFSELHWEESAPDLKVKTFIQDNNKVRLLQLSKGLIHPDFCYTGHIGYVIEGIIDIDFNGNIIRFNEGDVLLIRDGETDKHIPIPISDTVILLLIETP